VRDQEELDTVIVANHRYKASGVHIYRSDECGAITVRTDGRSVWVEPCIGGPVELCPPVSRRLAETLMPPMAAPR